MRLSQLKSNIAANFVGKLFTAVAGILAIPWYLRFMGVEAYGLVGVFVTIQSFFTLLDFGMGTALTRELARLHGSPGQEQQSRNLVRTLEVVYWAAAVALMVLVWLTFPLVADHLVNPERLTPQAVRVSFQEMGFALCLQLPFALYSGGLVGLQRQVALNALGIAASAATVGGALAILAQISPTPQAFFAWECVISAAQTIVAGVLLWRSLPPGSHPRFHLPLLRGIATFAGVMGVTSILGVARANADKIILAKLLPLQTFGYYSLAATVASGLFFLASPINIALYPRLSQEVARGEGSAIRSLYHSSCQLAAIAVLPATVVLALFAGEFVQVWTGSPGDARATHALLTALVIAAAFNVLLYVPTALQLAHGWAELSLIITALSLPATIGLVLWSAVRLGPVGAAAALAVVNGLAVLLTLQLMHRRLLRGDRATWFLRDMGMPLLAALAVAVPARLLLPATDQRGILALWLVLVSLLSLGAATLAASSIRKQLAVGFAPSFLRVLSHRGA